MLCVYAGVYLISQGKCAFLLMQSIRIHLCKQTHLGTYSSYDGFSVI